MVILFLTQIEFRLPSELSAGGTKNFRKVGNFLQMFSVKTVTFMFAIFKVDYFKNILKFMKKKIQTLSGNK